MNEQRNWAIVVVSTDFVPTFEAYLPRDHRIMAVRHLDDGTDELLVSGPDMPIAHDDQPTPRTDLRISVDETGTYCYWAHATHKRWQV